MNILTENKTVGNFPRGFFGVLNWDGDQRIVDSCLLYGKALIARQPIGILLGQ